MLDFLRAAVWKQIRYYLWVVSDFQLKPNIICYSRAPWSYASHLLQIILPPICEQLCDTGGLARLECGIPSAVTAPLWQIVLSFIYSGCCFVAVKWTWHDKVRVKLLCWANFITSVEVHIRCGLHRLVTHCNKEGKYGFHSRSSCPMLFL